MNCSGPFDVWASLPYLQPSRGCSLMPSKGRQIKRLVIEIVEQYSIPVNNALIYSYWHDFRALGLAMLRLEDPKVQVYCPRAWLGRVQ